MPQRAGTAAFGDCASVLGAAGAAAAAAERTTADDAAAVETALAGAADAVAPAATGIGMTAVGNLAADTTGPGDTAGAAAVATTDTAAAARRRRRRRTLRPCHSVTLRSSQPRPVSGGGRRRPMMET